jgi:hypothetical protein
MSVRPHNWTRGGLIFTEVCFVHTKFCLKLDTLCTKTIVLVRHCLAAAKVQRNVNSVCCAERGEAHLQCPHFWCSFEIVYGF